MKTTVKISTALSAAVGIPLTITLFPPVAIPVAVITVITATIVVWHLKRGGRALVRRSPKGTLTFVLDSTRQPSNRKGRSDRPGKLDRL
jgi:hypothetical protein